MQIEQQSHMSYYFSNHAIPTAIRLSVAKSPIVNRNESVAEANDVGQVVEEVHNITFIEKGTWDWRRTRIDGFQHRIWLNLQVDKKQCMK